MKQKVPMIGNIVSLILLIVFVIKSIVDYTQYSTSLNSAPFYLWVLVNALFLVIPAIIVFVIGFVVKKKPHTFRVPRQHLSQRFCTVHFSGYGEPAGACRRVRDRFGGDVDGGDRECDLSADEGGAGAEGCDGLLAETLA